MSVGLLGLCLACGGETTKSTPVIDAPTGGGGADAAPSTPDAAPMPDVPMATMPDAATPKPDAAAATADAAAATPDAAPTMPDAAVATPDAAPTMPDAAAPVPDSPPGTPDALSPPDARVTPAAPTAVTASPSVTKGAIVSWTAPIDSGASAITGYFVTATCNGSGYGQNVEASATSTVFSLSGLAAGTSCTFRVHATNAEGNGADSTASAPVVLADGPAAPTPSICGGTHRVYITAPAVSGAVSYNVYRSTAAGVTKLTGTKTSGALPYADATVTDGTTYHYVVAAVDANGVESIDSSDVSAAAVGGFKDVLFAATNREIAISDCQSQVPNGDARMTRSLQGDATLLGSLSYSSIFVDATNRRLYVVNYLPAQILVWDNAGTVGGNVAPTRVISGTGTGLISPVGVFVDAQHDRLYVSDLGAGSGNIRIWSNASTVDGEAAPDAVLTGLSAPRQLYVHSAADALWVAAGSNVLVYGKASTLTGTVAASRTLTFPYSANLFAVWVDPGLGRAFVGSSTGNVVYVVENAATADGAQDPPAVTGDDIDGTVEVQVRNDILYTLNTTSSFVHTFTSVSNFTMDTSPAPAREIGTGLTYPSAFFVVP